MSRYYFHVRQQATLFEDMRGGEFSSLPAAYRWAIQDARAMIAEQVLDGPMDQLWIEICDGQGARLATLPFGLSLPRQ
jgi:hypothetical protein